MSNELKIDLSKLSLEELEKIKFLMPEAVEAEIANRATYDTDEDMFSDAYEVSLVLKPLYENMKSCATKRTLTDSNVIPFLDKLLATADKLKRDYKRRYENKVNNGVMKPVEAPSAEALEGEAEEVAQAQAPAPAPITNPSDMANMVAQAPAPDVKAAPVVEALAPAGNNMADIMAMAQALAAAQQQVK